MVNYLERLAWGKILRETSLLMGASKARVVTRKFAAEIKELAETILPVAGASCWTPAVEAVRAFNFFIVSIPYCYSLLL
jgi:hypothetical protein